MVTEATAEIRALLIRDGCSEETADRVLKFADEIREQVAVQVEEQLQSRDGKIDALAASVDALRSEMRERFAAAKVESEQRQTRLLEEIANIRVEHERNIRAVDQRISDVREEIAGLRVEQERSISKLREEIAAVRAEITDVRAETERSIGKLRAEQERSIGKLRAEQERSIGELRLEIANLRADMANDSKEINARISKLGWAAVGLIASATAAIIGAVAAFG